MSSDWASAAHHHHHHLDRVISRSHCPAGMDSGLAVSPEPTAAPVRIWEVGPPLRWRGRGGTPAPCSKATPDRRRAQGRIRRKIRASVRPLGGSNV